MKGSWLVMRDLFCVGNRWTDKNKRFLVIRGVELRVAKQLRLHWRVLHMSERVLSWVKLFCLCFLGRNLFKTFSFQLRCWTELFSPSFWALIRFWAEAQLVVCLNQFSKARKHTQLEALMLTTRDSNFFFFFFDRNTLLVPIFRGYFQFGPCDLKVVNWVTVFLSRYQFYPWSQLR